MNSQTSKFSDHARRSSLAGGAINSRDSSFSTVAGAGPSMSQERVSVNISSRELSDLTCKQVGRACGNERGAWCVVLLRAMCA